MPEPQYIIRPILHVEELFDDVMGLCMQMADESPVYRVFQLDRQKLSDYIIRHATEKGYLLRVAEYNGKIVGVFMAVVRDVFFGRGLIASDDLFYLLPMHRGRGVMKLFLAAYHEWAEKYDPVYIQIGLSAGIDNQSQTQKALERHNYEPIGTLLRRK